MIAKSWSAAGLLLAAVCAGAANANDCAFDGLDMPAFTEAPGFDKPFIFVGEMHGTTETPTFTAALACQLAAEGLSVLVALEQPQNVQLPMRQDDGHYAFALDDDGLSERYWFRKKPDGRTSAAMLAMIDRLQELAADDNARIDIQGVDIPWEDDEMTIDRDGHMAENIQALWSTDRYDRVVVLAGNYHTRLPGDKVMDTIVAGVDHDQDDSYSVAVRSPRGQIWACMGATCGEQDMGGGKGPDRPILQTVADEYRAATPYSAVLWLPHFTASPPALP
ncbi:MAG: hypothetical protein EP335_17520 [Alphaproteobacteria bacterium]|nr:MAG: hypothetical protein EP335_17520 [Alphaproteobacteria bacterium]